MLGTLGLSLNCKVCKNSLEDFFLQAEKVGLLGRKAVSFPKRTFLERTCSDSSKILFSASVTKSSNLALRQFPGDLVRSENRGRRFYDLLGQKMNFGGSFTASHGESACISVTLSPIFALCSLQSISFMFHIPCRSNMSQSFRLESFEFFSSLVGLYGWFNS